MRPLVLALFCATACPPPRLPSRRPWTIGVRGGPDSIDPHFTATGTHAESLKHIFDTLVWSGDGLELEPRLALSWKPVNDTTWGVQAAPGREIP